MKNSEDLRLIFEILKFSIQTNKYSTVDSIYILLSNLLVNKNQRILI